MTYIRTCVYRLSKGAAAKLPNGNVKSFIANRLITGAITQDLHSHAKGEGSQEGREGGREAEGRSEKRGRESLTVAVLQQYIYRHIDAPL